jgi:hypothetical protein
MIRGNFQAHGHRAVAVEAVVAGRAAEGFGQRHRGAAVQQAVGLPRAFVHRHAAAQEIRAGFGELDAQRRGQRRTRVRVELGDIGFGPEQLRTA